MAGAGSPEVLLAAKLRRRCHGFFFNSQFSDLVSAGRRQNVSVVFCCSVEAWGFVDGARDLRWQGLEFEVACPGGLMLFQLEFTDLIL